MDKLKITIPGKPEYLTMVRLAVGSIATTAGFPVDDIEDIKAKKDKLNENAGFTESLEAIQNKTIMKIEYDMTHMGYNTVISSLMILTNAYDDLDSITKEDYHLLLTLLNPIAPHITEELNEKYEEASLAGNAEMKNQIHAMIWTNDIRLDTLKWVLEEDDEEI